MKRVKVKLLRKSKLSKYPTAGEIDYVQKSIKKAMDDCEAIAKMAAARYQHLSRALSGFNNVVMRLAPDLIEQQ
jgi:hypothetical protein